MHNPLAAHSRRIGGFYDFDEYERLVNAAKSTDPNAYFIVLLGGEAGLRCGEIMALEWSDVDLGKRQLRVQRSAGRVAAYAEDRAELGATISAAGEHQAGRTSTSPHVLFATGDARRTSESYPGTRRSHGSGHDAALHALESGSD